jgi:hypothetical protein
MSDVLIGLAFFSAVIYAMKTIVSTTNLEELRIFSLCGLFSSVFILCYYRAKYKGWTEAWASHGQGQRQHPPDHSE